MEVTKINNESFVTFLFCMWSRNENQGITFAWPNTKHHHYKYLCIEGRIQELARGGAQTGQVVGGWGGNIIFSC